MEKISSIKEILYSEIKKIPEKQIHQLLQNNEFSQFIQHILEKTIPRIKNLEIETEEQLGVLAESLSHYILTEMLIPSQRKIIHQNIEIDILVPNLNYLKNDPNNAVIIHFDKSNESNKTRGKIEQLKSIQKNNNNIWVVTNKESSNMCKMYRIDQNKESFSNLFIDIKNFVSNKNLDRLKIFKT